MQRPDHFLILEPDPELREILVAEIGIATKVGVVGAGPAELGNASTMIGAVPLVLYGHLEAFGDLVKPGTDRLVIHSGSVVESFRRQTKPQPDALVAIVSPLQESLRWSCAML